MQLKPGQEILGIRWTTQHGFPELKVTEWQDSEKVVNFYDFPFYPYCFCYTKDADKVKELADDAGIRTRFANCKVDKYLVHDDLPATKIEAAIPTSIGELRDYVFAKTGIKLLEADIRYGVRVWVDLGLKVPEHLPAGLIDIETDPRGKSSLMLMENPTRRVLSTAIGPVEGDIRFICHDNEHLIYHETDEELKKYGFAVSWSQFDMRYLTRRGRVINFWIHKIPSVDLMFSFLRIVVRRSDRGQFMSLVNCCKELGIGLPNMGVKDDIMKVWDFFLHDRPSLKKYNVSDVWAMQEIDKKTGLIHSHQAMAQRLMVPVESTVYNSQMIDVAILRFAKKSRPQIVLPCKPVAFLSPEEKKTWHQRSGGKFKGAFVFQPIPGVHTWTVCLDFKTMYPNITTSCNIGIDTLINVRRLDSNQITTPNGVSYIPPEVRRSLQSQLIGYLTAWKDELTVEYDKAKPDTPEKFLAYSRRRAVKVILVATYGVTGSPYCRLYHRDVAESVTQTGVWGIKKSGEHVSIFPFVVDIVYGDTDSIFVEIKADSKEDALEKGVFLAEAINAFLKTETKKEFGKSVKFNIEVDKIYKVFYLQPGYSGKGVKKKYVGRCIWEKSFCDYVDVMGFELRRRDWTGLAKKVQGWCFDQILAEKTIPEIEGMMVDYLRDLRHKLFTGQLDDKLVISKSLTRKIEDYKANTPHVRAAKKLLEKGLLDPRERIYYVITKWPPAMNKAERKFSPKLMQVEPVIGEEIPRISLSGYEYYWVKQVQSILKRLQLQPRKWSQPELKAFGQGLDLKLLERLMKDVFKETIE